MNLLRNQSLGKVLGKVGVPDRYLAVDRAFPEETVALGDGCSHPPILFGLPAAALRLDSAASYGVVMWVASATPAAMPVIYAGVHLGTRDYLAWLLGTSLGRLYSHIWPLAVLVVFLLLGRLREPAPREPALRCAKKAR